MPALAHTATSGGPNTEIVLLGVGALVLAAVFFFQKSAPRRTSVVLAVAGVAAIAGAFTLTAGSGSDHHDVSIAIVSPADGATLEAGAVPVEIELAGAELASESSTDDAGHLHVYVDGEVVDMPSALEVEVELGPGEHDLEVEFVDADHRALDPPVTDAVSITAE